MLSTSQIHKAVKRALKILPTLVDMTDRDYQHVKSPQMHILIMRSMGYQLIYSESFGDPSKWPRDFTKIAEAKARFTCHTEMNSSQAESNPMFLHSGDAIVGGSIIVGDYIISVSGWEPELDEMLASVIGAVLMATSKFSVKVLLQKDEKIVK